MSTPKIYIGSRHSIYGETKVGKTTRRTTSRAAEATAPDYKINCHWQVDTRKLTLNQIEANVHIFLKNKGYTTINNNLREGSELYLAHWRELEPLITHFLSSNDLIAKKELDLQVLDVELENAKGISDGLGFDYSNEVERLSLKAKCEFLHRFSFSTIASDLATLHLHLENVAIRKLLEGLGRGKSWFEYIAIEPFSINIFGPSGEGPSQRFWNFPLIRKAYPVTNDVSNIQRDLMHGSLHDAYEAKKNGCRCSACGFHMLERKISKNNYLCHFCYSSFFYYCNAESFPARVNEERLPIELNGLYIQDTLFNLLSSDDDLIANFLNITAGFISDKERYSFYLKRNGEFDVLHLFDKYLFEDTEIAQFAGQLALHQSAKTHT